MRTYIAVVISAFLGAVIGGLIFILALSRWDMIRSTFSGFERPSGQRGVAGPPSVPPTIPGAPGLGLPGTEVAGQPAVRSEEARQLLASGRVQEAQDAYLTSLLLDPLDQVALKGLVSVRRRLARNDPALLRRQAATYEQAASEGGQTAEHYTPEAMELLAQASLLAAKEIESERGIRAQPVPPARPTPLRTVTRRPPPAPPTLTPRPVRTPRPRATPSSPRLLATPAPAPTPRPPVPSPAPTPPRVPPTPQPSLDVNEPFVLIVIGPIAEATRASEIAADLTVAGYAARVSRRESGAHFITLGPYRRSTAEGIVRTVRARLGGLPVALTPAP